MINPAMHMGINSSNFAQTLLEYGRGGNISNAFCDSATTLMQKIGQNQIKETLDQCPS